MKLTLETTIMAPIEAVFATMTEIERWPDIISGISDIEVLTAGPMAIGTTFRETRQMYGRTATEEMTVAEFNAPHLFVLTAENHGTFYRAEHVLEPDGENTRMKMSFEGTPVTLFARLLSPLGLFMKNSVKKMLEADLAELKSAAEQRS